MSKSRIPELMQGYGKEGNEESEWKRAACLRSKRSQVRILPGVPFVPTGYEEFPNYSARSSLYGNGMEVIPRPRPKSDTLDKQNPADVAEALRAHVSE